MPITRERDVLVKVLAVTVNAADTFIRGGAFQMMLPFPFIIGRDLTGVVAEVGKGVSQFRPGDRVWANNQGYTVLWVCCFLCIRPTLVIDFGAGITVNFKLTAILLGLLVIVLYHMFYHSSAEVTKLSLTVARSVFST